MDMLSVHHSSKSCKRTKPKNKSKPIKVVYISNPIKVKTTASEFRAKVQELTGRDSGLGGGTERFSVVDGGLQTVPDDHQTTMKAGIDHYYVPQVPQVVSYQESPGNFDENLYEVEPFHNDDDDVFNPQMLENFAGFLPLLSIS
ncbi:sigma factor binding protein 1, chloroplastic-like [Macadamia integrifolia]|uniref:sigma factor binding protein 1, chloroplastic-like n=1 Tax=Macadamia integrifolia TaxID=60698 RepID=UPI001C4F649A|nr:sigma factor binding protein 1, chloroplastic-like [Macadamia integrifolia]